MCFAMAQIPWRRSDQLRNLVAMLEFSAIDLNNRARALHQRFGRGFDDARLAGTGGTKEQKTSDRAAGRGHPPEIHLIDVHDLLDGFILSVGHSTQAHFHSFCLSSCSCPISSNL